MKSIFPLCGFLLLLLLFAAGCEQEDVEPDQNQDTVAGKGIRKQQKYLLRTVEWKSFGQTAAYTYNADSTIKQVGQVDGNNAIYFTYQNGALVEMALEGSDYKNNYAYNAAGQMLTWTRAKKQPTSYGSTYLFEYKYNGNGTVSEMDYFKINEAGKQLVYHNQYEYNAQKLLSKVTATARNGQKIVWTIESYSEPFDFDPWVFISHDLSEKYELYNYPVLSKLTRLPRKMTKTVITQGQPARVEQVLTTDFTISQEKLEKMVNSIEYPAHPELNASSEVVYSYY
ncbi:hypothetical protein [Sabulibacter ruber]|uniref:hypothetical protein n=1 Tax=Sabulibacter ruber TaxID=2811901 RepID=UPI001A96BC77|nr:hypothetical protein [Sabulibacter ruber]